MKLFTYFSPFSNDFNSFQNDIHHMNICKVCIFFELRLTPTLNFIPGKTVDKIKVRRTHIAKVQEGQERACELSLNSLCPCVHLCAQFLLDTVGYLFFYKQ